jgi:hypothetical protein
MDIEVTLRAIITVPDGSTIPDDEVRMILLPNGGWVKPFIVLERNDNTDLDFADLVALGLDLDEHMPVLEVI